MERMPSVADLVRQLRAFHGYRTLWVEPNGVGILHSEPDDELEDLGYRYVTTVMRPGPEELAAALTRAGVRTAPPARAEASGTAWSAGAPLSI